MTNLRLAADLVEREIKALIAACPEMLEDEQLRADMIEGETDAREFLGWLTREFLAAKGLEEGAASASKVLAERKARFSARREAFKVAAQRIWVAMGSRKQELPEGTLNTRAGRDIVEITDLDFVPDAFLRKEPKKAEILDALKSGTSVPGAKLSKSEASFAITT